VIFVNAAEPGEWAVPGTFLFWGRDLTNLSRKEQIAFRSGFVGVISFGFSTLVTMQDATAAERAEMVEALAEKLVHHLGRTQTTFCRLGKHPQPSGPAQRHGQAC
jgi:hypothetical protein